MSAYPETRSLPVFIIGGGNMVAKPSFSPGDPPPASLTDARIKTWNDTLEEWVVADSTAADGTETAGGSGILVPQIALRTFDQDAVGFRFISIAEQGVDVDVFDPASPDEVSPGVNRWQRGIDLTTRAGLEPEVLLVDVGDDTSTILTQADIKAHHLAILDAAFVAWPSLRRAVVAIPPVRVDVPAGTQTARGEMYQAIQAAVEERAARARFINLGRWHLRMTSDPNYPYQTTTQYGEIAREFEGQMRAEG